MFVVLHGLVRVGGQHIRCESNVHACSCFRTRKFEKPLVEQRATGWLWLIKKAMNGMRTASKDFGDLVADVMKEIQFERGKADPQIHKDTKSQAAIVFHGDDPILAASHQQTALVWNRIGKHMLLKAHEVMTHDRPIKYLSRQYLKVHTHERRGSKSVYLKNILTALRHPWKRLVVDRDSSQGVRDLDQQRDELAKIREQGANDHSRFRAGDGKLQFMINEVPEIASAGKNLSRQLAGSSEMDIQHLKQCVRWNTATSGYP